MEPRVQNTALAALCGGLRKKKNIVDLRFWTQVFLVPPRAGEQPLKECGVVRAQAFRLFGLVASSHFGASACQASRRWLGPYMLGCSVDLGSPLGNPCTKGHNPYYKAYVPSYTPNRQQGPFSIIRVDSGLLRSICPYWKPTPVSAPIEGPLDPICILCSDPNRAFIGKPQPSLQVVP